MKRFKDPYKQARLESGLCTDCGGQRDGKQMACATCRARMSAYGKLRRISLAEKKQCNRCSTQLRKDTNILVCDDCWLRHIAIVTCGKTDIWVKLKNLWEEQEGRCIYSNEVLIPGVNASVDHKIPKCQGGDNSPENLQWVTSDLNRIKGKMTHWEFVELCQRIAKKFDKPLSH